MGRKNFAQWRVVAVDVHRPRDGEFLENLGWYDPHRKDSNANFKLDMERVEHWLSCGAMKSPIVDRLIRRERKKAVSKG